MQKESDAEQQQQHYVSVFLARRCFFRSRRRSATLSVSRSLGAPARARARYRAFYTPRLRLLRLLSRGARYLTVKISGEKGNRRAHSRRRPAVRGGREIAREIPTLKADGIASRPRVRVHEIFERRL